MVWRVGLTVMVVVNTMKDIGTVAKSMCQTRLADRPYADRTPTLLLSPTIFFSASSQ